MRNLGDDCGGSSLAATPAPSCNVLLDKKNTNAFSFENTIESIPDGGVWIAPQRSGGSLDPLGKRSVDVWQSNDLVAVVDDLKLGRWVFITLTTGRDQFLSPKLAYERCNPRVSKVMDTVCRPDLAPQAMKINFVACEVQGKTGDGWAHWHVLAWIPPADTRTIDQIKSDALKKWRLMTEHVDRETGEVTRSYESIGEPWCQKFELARSAEGTARYICKYIVKTLPAVPEWIHKHTGRFRCMRFSNGAFDYLEQLQRHYRRRGARPEPKGVVRPARTILDRMAASGSSCNVFRREGSKLSWLCTLAVPVTEFARLIAEYGGTYAREPIGGWHKGRVAMAAADFRLLKRHETEGKFDSVRQNYLYAHAHAIATAWNRSQGIVDEDDTLEVITCGK